MISAIHSLVHFKIRLLRVCRFLALEFWERFSDCCRRISLIIYSLIAIYVLNVSDSLCDMNDRHHCTLISQSAKKSVLGVLGDVPVEESDARSCRNLI